MNLTLAPSPWLASLVLGLAATLGCEPCLRLWDALALRRLRALVPLAQTVGISEARLRLGMRAWGLALRKRFCRTFNFELQAAASEDAILLSLGPTHSFPLEDVFKFLHSASAKDVLVQALGLSWALVFAIGVHVGR